MGNNIASQQIVNILTVRGREFEVERIAWTNSEGLSFDVTDVATGQLLTAESFDDQPDATDVEDLLDSLAFDLDSGTLDSFFEYEETRANLHQILVSDWEVTYEVRSGMDGFSSIVGTETITVQASTEEDAAQKAITAAYENDVRVDERLDPTVEVISAERA